MTSPLPASDKLARRLAELEGRLKRLEAGRSAAQLSHSSIEDGAIRTNDSQGNLRQKIGRQSDGTFAVTYANGDKPPMPSVPTVGARQLAVVVGWDGTFADDAAKPGDFARVDVHMDANPDFEPDGSTLYGSLVGEGALAIPSDYETHYVRIVAVTLADVPSDPTEAVAVEPLAASAISADWVYAGDVAADQITTGTLNADVTVSSTLSTGTEGARVQLNGNGFTAYDESDNMTVKIPTSAEESAVFRGDVEADGLVVTGRSSFRSDDNEVSKSGAIVLQSSTTNPQTPPSVENVWQREDHPELDGLTVKWLQSVDRGDGPELWTGVEGLGGYLIKLGSSSTIEETYNPVLPQGYHLKGFGWLDGYWWLLLEDQGTRPPYRYWHARQYDPDTGTFTGKGVFLDYIQTRNLRYVDVPCLGVQEELGRILIGRYIYADGVFRISYHDGRTDNNTVPWLGSATTSTNPGFNGPVIAVDVGEFDLGVSRYLIKTTQQANGSPSAVWFFNATNGAYDTTNWFPLADNNNSVGFCWHDGNFISMNAGTSGAGKLVVYGGNWGQLWPGTVPKDFDVAYTWGRHDGVSFSYETEVSPKAVIPFQKRAQGVRITSPSVPNFGDPTDPNVAVFYAGPKDGTLYQRGYLSAGSYIINPTATTGSQPPATNTFPESTPATIRNPSGTLEISGNGRIRGLIVEPAQFLATRTSTFTLGNGSEAEVVAWNVQWNTLDVTYNSSTGEFTVPVSGWYELMCKYGFGSANDGTGRRVVYVRRNGSTFRAKMEKGAGDIGSTAGIMPMLMSTVYLEAGDVLKVWLYQNVGGSMTVGGHTDSGPCEFRLKRIG